MTHSPYPETYRRALLDIQISDWDPEFMTKFDPIAVADAYKDANLSGAMIYCKSHMGLNNWPAPTGPQHPGLGGRDVIGPLVQALHDRDISVCAYTSLTWDYWAWENHPNWRTDTGLPPSAYWGRIGTVCMNSPEYRDYEASEIRALAAAYPFDAIFIDMVIWDGYCACEHCEARYRQEEGRSIPDTIDWDSAEWVKFQRARERWSAEFCDLMRDAARAGRPGIPFYSNATLAFEGFMGRGFDSVRKDTFVGGDRYGGREDQMMATKLFAAIQPASPPEYITGRVNNFAEHVDIKSESAMTQRALAAMVLNSALLITDCVNPDGTINRSLYEQMGRAYGRVAPFEPYLGGTHVEQVGLYFSEWAQVDILAEPRSRTVRVREKNTHADAWLGAARALQRAHIPFGAVTRYQLHDLDRFDVIVLPNLAVMSEEETVALRSYVERGGRLYASGHTGIVTEAGVASEDFSLSDVFGVHWDGNVEGRTVYLRPESAELSTEILPQDYLSHVVDEVSSNIFGTGLVGSVIPRLTEANDASTVLARLSLPYNYPHSGYRGEGGWASIHTDPPWEHTARPTIVENDFGKGRAIYSTAPIEFKPGKNSDVFVWLIKRLIDRPLAVTASTHPAVWVEAYDQPDKQRLMVAVMNYQDDGFPVPTNVELTVNTADREIAAVRRAVTGDELEVEIRDGSATFSLGKVEYADMILVEYA